MGIVISFYKSNKMISMDFNNTTTTLEFVNNHLNLKKVVKLLAYFTMLA